jgi:alkyl hydroperoxide reductase subunit AhpC
MMTQTQGTDLKFPIIADPTREVATLYDMVCGLDWDLTSPESELIPSRN